MSNEEKEEKIEITDTGVMSKLTEVDKELSNSNNCLLPFEQLEIMIIADKDFFKRSIIKKYSLDSSYTLMISILKNKNIEQDIDKDYTMFLERIKKGIRTESSKYNDNPQNLNATQIQREKNSYYRIYDKVKKIENERDNILKIIKELKKIYDENKESINMI